MAGHNVAVSAQAGIPGAFCLLEGSYVASWPKATGDPPFLDFSELLVSWE